MSRLVHGRCHGECPELLPRRRRKTSEKLSKWGSVHISSLHLQVGARVFILFYRIMRRHSLLRVSIVVEYIAIVLSRCDTDHAMQNSSTQSLCIFCTLRLSGQVAPVTTPQRRFLNTTRRSNQQAAAQAPQQDAAPQNSQWTFDPESSLSPSEQREKAYRLQMRREREEQEAAEAQRKRHEEEKRQHDRQIREFQQREEAQKARRKADEEGRREAQTRSQAARDQQAVQRSGAAGSSGVIRPGQSHENQQSGHVIRRVGLGSNRGAVSTASNNVQGLNDSKESVSQSLFGQEQVPQVQRAQAQSGRKRDDDRVSQSLFGQKQVPKVRTAQGGLPEQRSRTSEKERQRVQMPSFGGSTETEQAATGWGRGGADIQPLQYKTDEQIHEEAAAQREREEQSRRERREETERQAQARRDEKKRQAEQRRQRQRDRDAAASEKTAPRWTAAPPEPAPPPPQSFPFPPPPPHTSFEEEGQYTATPLNSTDYQPTPTPPSDQAWQNAWEHLAPRQTDSPPPPQQRYQPPSSTVRHQNFEVEDDQTIDRKFEEHRRERDARAQSPFSNYNITNAAPPRPAFSNGRPQRTITCARCQEVGHHARDCLNAVKCSRCQMPGHYARNCPNMVETRKSDDRAGFGGDAFASRGAEMREFGNIFRKTQAPPTEGPFEGEAVDPSFGRTRRDFQPAPERRGDSTPAQRRQEDRREAFERPIISSRGRAVLEEEPEIDGEESRRSRRSRRGFADEAVEAEETTAPKSYERRKEGRGGRRREVDEDADDEALAAREERAARKAAKQAQEKAAQEKKKAARAAGERTGGGTQVHLPEFVSVSNLAQQLGIGYEPFVERLEKLGYDDVFPGKVLNRETSGMIAMEYDFDPVYEGTGFTSAKSEEEERDLKAAPEVEDTTFLPTRPPVVTIMGHVDHGKTTILDYLRRTSVAAGEAGGITQHIGAFSVPLSSSGRNITFLDTPGHAAFMSMRQRGANVTDIVILVVAADDSVKPQTLESIRCAREAGVPMVVAVNKVDKPEADVQRVKNDLSRHGVEIEDFGGEVQVVEVSGKTGQGLDALEENIVTLSEILDHRSDTEGAVEGWVLEATTKRAGRVATVLVRRGTLRPGAVLVAGKTWARVRTLRDERDQNVMEVGPGMPVEVDGWRDQPVAGDEVLQAPGEQKATDVVEYRLEKDERLKMEEDMEAINETRRAEQERRKAAEKAAKAAAANAEGDSDTAPMAAAPEPQEEQSTGQQAIPFIIKADVSGSAEAVAAYVPSLTSPLIAPDILASSVGAINESDIELASASKGHIIAFNLPKNEEMRGLAESKGVLVLENNIIYRTLDQVREVLEARLPPIVTQKVIGEAEVGQVFEIGIGGRRKMKIAGCKVRNGAVARNARVRVWRGGEKVYDGEFALALREMCSVLETDMLTSLCSGRYDFVAEEREEGRV